MNRQDVKAWLESEITIYFMGMLNILIQAEDENTHAALQRGDLQEAVLCNAGLSAYKEVRYVLPEKLEKRGKEAGNGKKSCSIALSTSGYVTLGIE